MRYDLNQIFVFMSFFCAILSFETCTYGDLRKIWKRFFANLLQTLTSEAKVLNPKASGVQGRSPGGRCGGQSPPPTKTMFCEKKKSQKQNFRKKILIFQYKIDQISKTKIITKNGAGLKKSVSEHWASFGMNFYFSQLVKFWTTIIQKLKIGKLNFHSFQHIVQLSCKIPRI